MNELFENLYIKIKSENPDININHYRIIGDLLQELSKLPVLDAACSYEEDLSHVFVSMKLVKGLFISLTRYFDDGDADKDLYFSVKGDGLLLFAGDMPVNIFIERTLEAIETIHE